MSLVYVLNHETRAILDKAFGPTSIKSVPLLHSFQRSFRHYSVVSVGAEEVPVKLSHITSRSNEVAARPSENAGVLVVKLRFSIGERPSCDSQAVLAHLAFR